MAFRSSLFLAACTVVLASGTTLNGPPSEVDVVIVGAGWSGLVAAHTLVLHNAQVHRQCQRPASEAHNTFYCRQQRTIDSHSTCSRQQITQAGGP